MDSLRRRGASEDIHTGGVDVESRYAERKCLNRLRTETGRCKETLNGAISATQMLSMFGAIALSGSIPERGVLPIIPCYTYMSLYSSHIGETLFVIGSSKQGPKKHWL